MRQTKPKYSKAFTYQRAGDSLRDRVSYGEARARAKTLALVSQPFTGETSKESLLFHLDYLEDATHYLTYEDSRAVRRRWKRYCNRRLEIIRRLVKGGVL